MHSAVEGQISSAIAGRFSASHTPTAKDPTPPSRVRCSCACPRRGHSRRLIDLRGLSALPPTPDVSLRRSGTAAQGPLPDNRNRLEPAHRHRSKTKTMAAMKVKSSPYPFWYPFSHRQRDASRFDRMKWMTQDKTISQQKGYADFDRAPVLRVSVIAPAVGVGRTKFTRPKRPQRRIQNIFRAARPKVNRREGRRCAWRAPTAKHQGQRPETTPRGWGRAWHFRRKPGSGNLLTLRFVLRFSPWRSRRASPWLAQIRKASDAEKKSRAEMALEFRMPDGGTAPHHDDSYADVSSPPLPQTFLDKFIALAIDPSTGEAGTWRKFKAVHGHLIRTTQSQAKFLMDNNPPPSYANCA